MICENIAGPACGGITGPPGPAAAWGSIGGVIDSQADLVAKFNTGTEIIVRGVSGNDATGARGRADLPFKTIEAAMAASVSGDQIFGYESITVATGCDLTALAKSVRLTLEAGCTVTIASGKVLFANATFSRTVTISGMGNIVGPGKIITGTTIFVWEGANLNTGITALDDYMVDLTGTNIVSIELSRTATQSTGGVGGFLRIGSGSQVYIRLPQCTDDAARLSKWIDIDDAYGSFSIAKFQGAVAAGAADAAIEIGLNGTVTIDGGAAFGSKVLVRLTATTNDGKLNMAGIVSQGTGTIIEHKAGRWCVDAGIGGPAGAGNPAILADAVANSSLCVRGMVMAGAGGDALRVNTVGQVEVAGKLYGNMVLADNAYAQVRDAAIIGQVKLVSGASAATIFGATTWATTTAPGAGVTVEAVAPLIHASLI